MAEKEEKKIEMWCPQCWETTIFYLVPEDKEWECEVCLHRESAVEVIT